MGRRETGMSEHPVEKSIKPGATHRALTREEVGTFPEPEPELRFNPKEILDRLAALEARVAELEAK